ncbi:MAG: GNAT family N-acetyltransferase [Proteobacteria bacterium]|nr:GNAT family N-acetyltransferase [Pseudomonadota bacterium]
MNLTARVLENDFVRLEPMEARHYEGLKAAGADPTIWTLQPFNIDEGFDAYFAWIREEQAHGRWMPHAVIRPDKRIVGQSCYLNIRPKHDGVEIGGTWYVTEARGTAINPAAKLLLFGHAFDSGAERVDQKTDAINARSRAAMLKSGATFEGIHRHAMRRKDGSWRDNAWYSVLREEWPAMKAGLETRLVAHR